MYSVPLRWLEKHAKLSSKDKDSLASLISGKPRRIQPRQQIVREGETRRTLLYLISGWACRYKHLEDGRCQILSFILPGDFCHCYIPFLGEMDHSVRTITDALAVEVDCEAFDALLESSSPLFGAFHASYLAEAAILREWVLSLGQRTATERCAHIICELFWRLRAVGLTHDLSFKFPLTQEEVGGAIGVSTVHANRVFQSLRNTGLIEQRGKTLKIVGLKALESFASFTPQFLHLQNPVPQTFSPAVSLTGDALALDTFSRPPILVPSAGPNFRSGAGV